MDRQTQQQEAGKNADKRNQSPDVFYRSVSSLYTRLQETWWKFLGLVRAPSTTMEGTTNIARREMKRKEKGREANARQKRTRRRASGIPEGCGLD